MSSPSSRRTVEVGLRLLDDRLADLGAERPAVEVAVAEVDPAELAGESGLVRRVLHGPPGDSDVLCRGDTRLDLRGPFLDGDRQVQVGGPGERAQDLEAGA